MLSSKNPSHPAGFRLRFLNPSAPIHAFVPYSVRWDDPRLTVSRLNLQRARHMSLLTVRFALTPTTRLLHSFGPILQPAPYPRTLCQLAAASTASPTSRITVDMAIAPLVYVRIAHLEGLTRPTHAATVRTPNHAARELSCLPFRKP